MNTELERQLSQIRVGDHLCLIYDRPREILPAAAHFLREGLERGEHAMYVVDDHDLDTVTAAFQGAGIDVARERERGALRFLSAREYCPLDEFDPQRMLARFRQLGDEMANAGTRAARAAIEMTWALTVGAPLDLLAEYECWGNHIFEHFTGVSLCMYNRSRFPAAAMERLLRAHPIVVLGDEVAPNPFYEPPEVCFAPEAREARRFEWMLERLRLARADRREREELLTRERDARARAEAAARAQFLAEAAGVLGGSLDLDETLRASARLAAGRLGDLAVVDVHVNGRTRRAGASVDPALDGLFEALPRFTRLPALAEPAGSAGPGALGPLAGGDSLVMNDLDAAAPSSDDTGARGFSGVRDLGVRALMAVPLRARGQVIGALTVASTRPERRYGPEDLELADQLAGLAGLAADNARLYEAALQARAEAEAANRSKTDFLSAMSHELRTPLNAIAGYVDLLDLGVGGTLPGKQRAMVDRIKQSQEHLLALIDDVLNFARLEGGHLEYRLEDVPVEALLDEVAAMLEPQATARGLLYVHRPCPPDLSLRCDRDRTRQIVLNLVGNAIKFTPSGGQVEVSCDAEGEAVVIRVSDTGPGIDADQMERIFDPFVQVGRDRHRDSRQGVGLGLAISRDLARGMDGDLTAVSEPEVGSTFVLRLPRSIAVAR